MKLFTRISYATLAIVATLSTGSTHAQNRNFGAQTFTMDDGAGHTFTMQAPSGLSGNTTYQFPTPPAGNPPPGFVNIGTAGQTLFWNGTAGHNAWEASSIITNNTNGNGTNVTITAPLIGAGASFTTLGASGLSTLAALTQTGVANINNTGSAATTVGTGGTGVVNIGNSTGNTIFTGGITTNPTTNVTNQGGDGETSGSLNWDANSPGYSVGVLNTGAASNADGLIAKTAGTAVTNKIFTANSGGTDRFTVNGDGSISAPGAFNGGAGSFTTLNSTGNSNIGSNASTSNGFGNGANSTNNFGMGGGSGGGNTNNQFGSTANTVNSFGNGALNNNVGVGSTGNFFGGAFFGNPQTNTIGGASGAATDVATNTIAEADNSATTHTIIGVTTAATATTTVSIGGGAGNTSLTVNAPSQFNNTVGFNANAVSGSNFGITGGTITGTSISGSTGSFTTLTASTSEIFSNLNSAGVVHNTAGGVLSTSQIATGDIANGAVDLTSKVTGVLPIANGGTGSNSQNFVDLSTAQSVGGNKTFTGSTTANTLASSGATITGGAISATPITGSTGSFTTLTSSGNTDLANAGTATANLGFGSTGAVNVGNLTGTTTIRGGDGSGSTTLQLQNRYGSAGAVLTTTGAALTDLGFKNAGVQSNLRLENRGGFVVNATNTNGELQFLDNATAPAGTVKITLAVGNSAAYIGEPLTVAGGVTGTSFGGGTGAFTSLTASTSETFSNLNSAGVVHNTAGGVLSTSQIATGDIANGAVDLTSKVTNVLPIANGGTGSNTQNFVDLSSAQTVGGNKTLSGTTAANGGLSIGNGGTIIRELKPGGLAVSTVIPHGGMNQIIISGGGFANLNLNDAVVVEFDNAGPATAGMIWNAAVTASSGGTGTVTINVFNPTGTDYTFPATTPFYTIFHQ